ncbi:MAG TPA: hypothetical protein DEA08_15440 [Planctomycetes bacterium]|nr:hypothetical protein [Planctomycetota bacterium]
MARSAKRGKQGKRLGEWVYLSKDAFLGWLERTRTTHGALAQELGVSAGLVSSWKAGRRFPSEVNQRKLAELVEGPGAGAGAEESAAFDAERFQAWRAERGLSRKALAKELGVSPGSIYQWESGKSQPRSSTLAKMREVIQAKGLTAPASRPQRATSGGATSGGGESVRAAAIRAAGATLAALISAQGLSAEEAERLAPRLRDAFLS